MILGGRKVTSPGEEGQGAGCTYNAEDAKDSENYRGGVIVSHKVIDSRANSEKDV